jgi:hypothetical protein
MIVIPPVSDFDPFFDQMAKSMWDLVKKHDPDMVTKTERGNRTLVIRSDHKDTSDMIITYYLHYRMFMGKLYCFIEEEDPENTTPAVGTTVECETT